MTTVIDKGELILTETCIYGRVDRWAIRWMGFLQFTNTGNLRLASILGYFMGLKHADRLELATRLVDDFTDSLDRLCHDRQLIDMRISTLETDTATVSVPSSKVILTDDSSFHSFGFMVYHPLSVTRYDECFAQTFTEQTGAGTEDLTEQAIHRLVVVKLNIAELDSLGMSLTAWQTVNGQRIAVYYVPAYNGGLIYHGPEAKQSYGSDNFWTIHT